MSQKPIVIFVGDDKSQLNHIMGLYEGLCPGEDLNYYKNVFLAPNKVPTEGECYVFMASKVSYPGILEYESGQDYLFKICHKKNQNCRLFLYTFDQGDLDDDRFDECFNARDIEDDYRIVELFRGYSSVLN